jgi:hypothetical protein
VHSAGTMEVDVGPTRRLVLEGRALGIGPPHTVDSEMIRGTDLGIGPARGDLPATVVAAQPRSRGPKPTVRHAAEDRI